MRVPLKAGSLALGMHGCQLESVSSQYLETARSSVDNALNHSTQNTDATRPGDQLCIMADRCPATTCRASSSNDAGTTDVNTVADRCIAPATAPRRSTASPRTTAPASGGGELRASGAKPIGKNKRKHLRALSRQSGRWREWRMEWHRLAQHN